MIYYRMVRVVGETRGCICRGMLLVAHVVFAQQAEMWASVARGGVVPLADQGETQPDQDG